jgi:signal transduction histidine kinase
MGAGMALLDFMVRNRDLVLQRTRETVRKRSTPRIMPEELDAGLPQFYDQVIDTLRRFDASLPDAIEAPSALVPPRGGELGATAARHGRQLHGLGFSATELRNALSNAMFAVQIIKKGAVGPSGRTGAMLDRNLARARDIVDRSLTQARLRSDVAAHPEHVALVSVIEEIEISAVSDADARGLALDTSCESGLELYADRQMIISAIANLVQNAIKFSGEGGRVALRASTPRSVRRVGAAPGRPRSVSRSCFVNPYRSAWPITAFFDGPQVPAVLRSAIDSQRKEPRWPRLPRRSSRRAPCSKQLPIRSTRPLERR